MIQTAIGWLANDRFTMFFADLHNNCCQECPQPRRFPFEWSM